MAKNERFWAPEMFEVFKNSKVADVLPGVLFRILLEALFPLVRRAVREPFPRQLRSKPYHSISTQESESYLHPDEAKKKCLQWQCVYLHYLNVF